jgi:hypothetical protein
MTRMRDQWTGLIVQTSTIAADLQVRDYVDCRYSRSLVFSAHVPTSLYQFPID